jgi:hypothetical protein
MCINIKTSIGAFLLGTISGLILNNSDNKEKKILGKFIIFYTMVQLFEGLIYHNNTEIYSKLLLINLGFQGLVFILLLNDYIPINKIYIYITGLIAAFICYKTIHPEFMSATTSEGMKWHFNDSTTSFALLLMYVTMFISVFDNNKKLDKINKMGILLFITFIISYTIKESELLCNINRPSMWCLSSAIVAPISLFI